MEDEIFESVESQVTGQEGYSSTGDSSYSDSDSFDGGDQLSKESDTSVNSALDDLQQITVEDLEIGKNVGIGAVVCGTGLLICLGVIGLLKILRQA